MQMENELRSRLTSPCQRKKAKLQGRVFIALFLTFLVQVQSGKSQRKNNGRNIGNEQSGGDSCCGLHLANLRKYPMCKREDKAINYDSHEAKILTFCFTPR